MAGTDSLWHRIEACAETSPDRLALIEPGEGSACYAQLWASITAAGQLLCQLGIGAHHTVAVILPDGARGLISVLGVARVCACAPINPAATAAELEADLLELNAAVVITTAELELPQLVALTLGLALIIQTSQTSPDAGGWRISAPLTKTPAPPGFPEGPPATILLHTSATTGRRKLVPLSAANLHAMFENTARALRLGPDDRLLTLARLFHTQGILSPCAQLLAGGSVILARAWTPQSICPLLETLEPTWYTCGPTLHRAILTYLEDHPLKGKNSLRFVRSGGSRLPADLRLSLERVLGVPVLNVYGLTETGAVACTSLDSGESARVRPAGDQVGGSMGPDIAVVSADGTRLPASVNGEIVVGGPSVMAGYLNDPDANRDAFFGPWFRTGDLGRLDEHGILHITGRLKEMINRGGQKIVPEEVEAVLTTHAAVLEAAAFAVPHPTLGEDVACAVVLKQGWLTEERELRDHAAKHLVSFKVPRRIYRVETLPYGATGKPLRVALKKKFANENAADAGPSTPASAPEEHLQSEPGPPVSTLPGAKPHDLDRNLEHLWRKHTSNQEIRADLDFFSSGGDSLSATAMLLEVEETAGLSRSLYAATFFQEPTLSTLATMVTAAIAGHTEASSNSIRLVPVSKGSGRLPLYMIPSNGEEGYGFRRLARTLGDAWPLALVRPETCWHERSVTSLEEAAVQAAEAIRAAKPPGPCLVGGYCYGGVVAYETVRQLESRGEVALLVLFDVPTPGRPHVIADWRLYLKVAAAAGKACRQSRRLAPAVDFADSFARRLAWSAVRRVYPTNATLRRWAPLRWLGSHARDKYFPFYRPGPVSAPLLHFLVEREPELLRAGSRLGWHRMAPAGTTVHWLPCDHTGVFDEACLTQIASAIESWPALTQAAAL